MPCQRTTRAIHIAVDITHLNMYWCGLLHTVVKKKVEEIVLSTHRQSLLFGNFYVLDVQVSEVRLNIIAGTLFTLSRK